MTQDKRRDELIKEIAKIRWMSGKKAITGERYELTEDIADFILARENKMLEEIEGIIQDPMIFYPDVRGKLLATINKYKGE